MKISLRLLIGAGFSLGSRPELGLLAALVAVFVAYVRAIGSSAGAGEVFAGPMAKPQRMALMTIGSLLCSLVSWMQIGADGRWQSHIIGTLLGLIVVGGIITSLRRLKIIGETIRATTMRDDETSSIKPLQTSGGTGNGESSDAESVDQP